MCEYRRSGFGDLTPEQFPSEWQDVMKHVEAKGKGLDIQFGTGPREECLEAAKMYCKEKVELLELVLGQPLGYPSPSEAPGTRKSCGGKPHEDSRVFYGTRVS
jgi:hypothetical protein